MKNRVQMYKSRSTPRRFRAPNEKRREKAQGIAPISIVSHETFQISQIVRSSRAERLTMFCCSVYGVFFTIASCLEKPTQKRHLLRFRHDVGIAESNPSIHTETGKQRRAKQNRIAEQGRSHTDHQLCGARPIGKRVSPVYIGHKSFIPRLTLHAVLSPRQTE